MSELITNTFDEVWEHIKEIGDIMQVRKYLNKFHLSARSWNDCKNAAETLNLNNLLNFYKEIMLYGRKSINFFFLNKKNRKKLMTFDRKNIAENFLKMHYPLTIDVKNLDKITLTNLGPVCKREIM